MKVDKKILDIRYYASNVANVNGGVHPHDCSDFFNFPVTLYAWGPRIARRLGNYDFSVGSFDHVYINYTTILPDGTIKISERATEAWFRYIDYGVSHDYIKELSPLALEKFVVDSTFHVLAEICKENQTTILDSIKLEVSDKGTEVEIDVATKITKSYSVSVSLIISPSGKGSYGIVNYQNIKTGESFKKKFIDLYNYEDLYPLIGAITTSKGSIIIKPKKSFRADLYTSKYKTPIIINIEENLV